MMQSSLHFRNILCIRADNMGDVIMSSAAIRALKETFGSRITLLTSRAGSLIVPYLDCVDAHLTADLPWVKTAASGMVDLQKLADEIASHAFDAAIVFTVYSQSALPAAMLAYLAGISVRIAYARENPYDLLTTWLPDQEPYGHILHQVERDLNLVRRVGAEIQDTSLHLRRNTADAAAAGEKLRAVHINMQAPFLVLHPGVSEDKRRYPAALWIEAGKMLAAQFDVPLLISGSADESAIASEIADGIGGNAVSIAGKMGLGEFIEIVGHAACLVSVNTAAIHIAAAVQTPVVVLYAETNPQHTPWQSDHEILPFSVPEQFRSQNPIIQYVASRIYAEEKPFPKPGEIVAAAEKLLQMRGSGLKQAYQ